VNKEYFDAIFAAPPPQTFSQLPDAWKKYQASAIAHYNETAPYNGKSGLPADQALPVPSLTQANFPEWAIGAYPRTSMAPPQRIFTTAWQALSSSKVYTTTIW
jgi:hypothetical protein